MNIALITAYFRARLDLTRADESGASAVEYGLLVALIAAVIIGVVLTLGETLRDVFTGVNDQMPAAPDPA